MAPQIITSTWPHPEYVRQNLLDFITSNPNNVPDDKAAFVRAADGKVYPRGQMFRDARRLAHAYVHKLKLKKGDRIGMFSSNSCFYPVAAWACYISGMVVVPISPGTGVSEFVHPAQDSGFKYLFVHPSMLQDGREGWKQAGSSLKTEDGINKIWLLTDSDSLEEGDGGEQDARTLLGDEEMQPIKLDDPENTLALVAYSGGTTGRSKS